MDSTSLDFPSRPDNDVLASLAVEKQRCLFSIAYPLKIPLLSTEDKEYFYCDTGHIGTTLADLRI